MRNLLTLLLSQKIILGIIISCIFGVSIWAKIAIVAYKDKAVQQAINEIKAQQKDLEIKKQAEVITQQETAFNQSQKIIADSKRIEKKIKTSTSTSEKILVKYSIIDNMNCLIENFNTNVLCEK